MRRFALLALVLIHQFTAALADDARTPVAVSPAMPAAGSFTVLCYHEVRGVREYPDPFAVNPVELVRQFAWLRGNGYVPVSLDAIVAARQGGKPLPAKAVLLSFDDAYLSFYTRVYPLLKEFRYPAVLGVVGRWIDQPGRVPVLVDDDGTETRESLARWSQLREMAASGLVEIASHTYDLHRGVPANPQGNLEPAATARIYDPATGRYEDDGAWRARVRADLARNSTAIERRTGHRPRTVVWPYGSYNDELVNIAGSLGMVIALTLNDGANTPEVPLNVLRRTLIEHNPALAEFTTEERGPPYPEPVRVVQVNLDDVYDADPAQQERNLSRLLDRIEVLRPTHVYLQATTDTHGDGVADAAYFPNAYLPVRADLLNRTAWQLASRIDLKVFVVMPLTELRLPAIGLVGIYEDLARHVNFDGLVFDDKPRPGSADAAGLIDLSRQIATRVRAFRAPLVTVRTLRSDSSPAMPPGAASQSFSAFLAAYDYVALVSTPVGEKAAGPDAWLAAQLARVGRTADDPVIRRKTIFMLENSLQATVDPSGDLAARRMRTLQLGRLINFGYFPDRFLQDDPPLAQTAPAMSLRVYPLAPGNKEK